MKHLRTNEHRKIIAAVLGMPILLALAACGGGGSGSESAPARGFQIQSPEIEIAAGQEVTYCYFFRTPNAETLAIKRWHSSMPAVVHDMILFFGSGSILEPPGTLDTSCGAQAPSWTYAAYSPEAEMTLPNDDGAGKPLGMEVPANQAAYLQMHFLNATNAPVKARVTLDAEALAAGVAYTRTDSFWTYKLQIDIPPAATGVVRAGTCATPVGARFWRVSTHTHKQAVGTMVRDGLPVSGDSVFTADDWEHPGAMLFGAPDFHTFITGKLSYECTYDNPSNRVIHAGNNAQTEEVCIATGYYFPATESVICAG